MKKFMLIIILFFLVSPLVNAGYDIWYYKEDRKGKNQGFVLKHYWNYERYEYGCADNLGAMDWRCYKVYYEPPVSSVNLGYLGYRKNVFLEQRTYSSYVRNYW